MKDAFAAFVARFRAANGLDHGRSVLQQDTHRKAAPPDQNLGLHYRPSVNGGPVIGGHGWR